MCGGHQKSSTHRHIDDDDDDASTNMKIDNDDVDDDDADDVDVFSNKCAKCVCLQVSLALSKYRNPYLAKGSFHKCITYVSLSSSSASS